jgi:hypothetical protein
VGALGVLAAERSWVVARPDGVCPEERPAGIERSALSPWLTRPAGTPRRRSPVSSRRCPPIRFRRPGSGCPAVRCPVTWGWSSRGSGARPSAVHPSRGLVSSRPASSRLLSSCLLSTRAVSSRLVSALVRPDASVSSPQAVALGTRSPWPGDPDPRNRWLPGRRRLDDGPGGRDAGDAAAVALVSGRSVADPGRRVGGGPRRRGRLRGGHGSRRSARWPHAAWLPSSGWGRDHGGWSWPSLTPGWADPEGHWRCRRGSACGPSAAQAGSEHARLAAGSALTCDDGWWACQDLNLGPHPYQADSRDAFKLVERTWPAGGRGDSDRGCPLGTGVVRPMWHAGGTAAEEGLRLELARRAPPRVMDEGRPGNYGSRGQGSERPAAVDGYRTAPGSPVGVASLMT